MHTIHVCVYCTHYTTTAMFLESCVTALRQYQPFRGLVGGSQVHGMGQGNRVRESERDQKYETI